MAERIWDWQLPSGEALRARLDQTTQVESVFLGPRLVSRSGVGGKAEGHAVSLVRAPTAASGPYRGPSEVVVTFAPDGTSCVARIGDQELPPAAPPPPLMAVPQAPAMATAPIALPSLPSVASIGPGKLIGAGVALLFAVLAVVFTIRFFQNARESAVARETVISASYPSPNGLLVAHHPAAFSASLEPNMPPGTSIVALRHGQKDESIFLASFVVHGTVPRDIWRIHELIQKDFIKALGPAGGTYVEEERTDGRCVGEEAAIVHGKIQVKGEIGNLWLCTFVHAGHPYRLMYAIAAKHVATDEPLLHAIIEATELTDPSGGR